MSPEQGAEERTLKEKLHDHILKQHVGVVARHNINYTEANIDNTGAQKLGSDVRSASSPNDDDMVTSTGQLWMCPPFKSHLHLQ